MNIYVGNLSWQMTDEDLRNLFEQHGVVGSAKIVKDNNLTPKVLVVHRFTESMVTNYKNITPLPEVQIVMQMDGFGSQGSKLSTYREFIYKQPVQFTGFKIFYQNDSVAPPGLFEPQALLKLKPIPVYIQYQ